MIRKLATAAAIALLSPLIVSASIPPEEEALEEIVTTGMRASQGGAQDIKFFRGEVEFQRIPHPNDFTAEGLMSEHDLVLPAAEPCRQLFCLTGDATRADLLAAPQARYLVGVGFASNIDEKKWRRDPVNLIAVVDKSGSMSGKPLELVRESLAEVAKQLRSGDQITIVLYGDRAHVHLGTTPVDRDGVGRILASISSIESSGSTSMEAGLRLGYSIAGTTAAAFRGRTRLMLFTDERPNTDATDAQSFMGLAVAHSREGVGLTTIGVGVQFGAELATKIGSVRGGNLYFIRDEPDVKQLFAGQLDYMVSELAHDLKLTIAPRAGLKIAAVYGIPGELLGWQNDREISVTIPTVFLDNHGGGIFFTLAPEAADGFLPEKSASAALADVSVSYLPIHSPAIDAHSISIAMPEREPSDGMKLGHLLIDEFTVLHAATTAHYITNDQEKAFQLLDAFKERLASSPLEGLDDEKKLIDSLHARIAFLSGHSSEGEQIAPYVKLWGRWTVERINGGIDLKRGETLEFTPDNSLLRVEEDDEEYRSNEKQIYLPESDVVFHYRIKGDKLTLHHRRANVWVRLRRVNGG
jgi:Ca-activated chloride channel family protein